MILLKCWCLLLFLLAIEGGTAPPKSDIEALATNLLASANEKIERHWMKLRDLFLTANRKYNQINHAPLYQETLNNFRLFSNQLAYNLSAIPVVELKSEQVRRQVKLLNKLQLMGLESDDYDKSQNLLRILKGLATSKIVCHYLSNECSVHVAQVPQITEIISKSRNLDELEFYWTSWRKEINEQARRSFVDFIHIFRKAAAFNGHVAPSRTWYLYYEDEAHTLLSEMETAINDLMPLYKQFHGYMRHALRQKYGQDVIAKGAGIPQHLMEQIIQHAWKSRSVFAPPHPDKKLPDIKHKMEHEIFTPLKINEIAAQFFESMGLHELSATFWIKYARKMSDEEAGPDCKAEVYYFPPDVALKYCPKVDFRKFLQMHGHMAELQYNMYRGRLPFGFDREACPGFSSALGEASIIAAGSPRHLEKLHLIENYTLDNELSLNRLFRLGVHTIFTIPLHFVNEKFLVDSLDHRININDLNCGYWKLQDQYAGVTPPSKRSETHFDPGHKFYSRLDPNKPNTIKIISELLGYQIYRSLCIKSKQYIPGDPDYPLHNCDFSGNHEIGQLISEVMSQGATKNWRDLMESLTQERKISAKAILKYYEPLYTWLKEHNEKNGIKIGWDPSEMCENYD